MLTRRARTDLTIWFEGQPVPARTGDSVAVALLAAGISAMRATDISRTPRGPYCLMGACFECLAVVDDRPGTQTCMTQVRDGMQVWRQEGAKMLP